MPNNNDALKQYNRQLVRWYIKYKEWKGSDPNTRGPEPERPVKPPVESKSNKGVMNMKVSHDIPPHRYELELAWKDKAFIDEGKIGFSITATKLVINEDGSETDEKPESMEASISIEPKDPEDLENSDPILRIKLPGDNQFNFDLRELLDESTVLDQIPASIFSLGDPILGCLIRSGLSTSIGQIIKCKNETAGFADWFLARTKLIGRCLLENVPNMTGKMAMRSGLCIFRVQL